MTASSSRIGLLPRPQEDETIGSFLLRLARNQSATPHELCVIVWPGLEFWPRDIDRTASDVVIAQVARSTGLSPAKISEMTLRNLVERMGWPLTSEGIQQGILPVGVYHRTRRRYGQQYCPECLKVEPSFLRRAWRLGFVTGCAIHGCGLSDACPHCDSPFVPHRADSLIDRKCHRCQSSLLDGNREPTNMQAMQLQMWLTNLLYGKPVETMIPWQYWRDFENPVELFNGVRRLCRLLTFSADGQGLQPHKSGLRWDFLRVGERQTVLSYVGNWIRDWPTSFLAWAERYNISRERVLAYGPWPQWIGNDVASLCSRARIHKLKPLTSLSSLRDEFGNTSAYRMARAKLLLDRASARGGAV